MYYVISTEENKILDTYERPPTEREVQFVADFFDVAVYVIRGEDYGMSAKPPTKDEEQEVEV